jgi:hypothetical protein
LGLSIGGVNKSATYVSTASNANTLVFSYTIASGDMTTTGITATTTALSLNTGMSVSSISLSLVALKPTVIGGILTDFALKANESKIYTATTV